MNNLALCNEWVGLVNAARNKYPFVHIKYSIPTSKADFNSTYLCRVLPSCHHEAIAINFLKRTQSGKVCITLP